jgi:hypothetical protein
VPALKAAPFTEIRPETYSGQFESCSKSIGTLDQFTDGVQPGCAEGVLVSGSAAAYRFGGYNECVFSPAQWRRFAALSQGLVCITGGASIDQAAIAAGYQSRSAFSEAFSQAFGFPPREAKKADCVALQS